MIGLVACCGCDRESKTTSNTAAQLFGLDSCPPVHFVVPVGFHGDILITTNLQSGLIPKTNTAGLITIDVPTNGIVTLKTWDVFECEHEESASFADGTPIPNPDMTPSGKIFPADQLGFYALGMEMHSTGAADFDWKLAWFIGTKKELEKRK